MNALLQIDESHVEPESVAAKSCDVGQSVTCVRDGQDGVHDETPYPDPSHEGEEVCAAGNDNIVDSVGEDGDRTGDADNDKRLAGEDGEDDAGEDGREENFIDAVGIVGFGEHVETEGEGWEDAR